MHSFHHDSSLAPPTGRRAAPTASAARSTTPVEIRGATSSGSTRLTQREAEQLVDKALRGRRKRGVPRARVVAVRRITQDDLRVGALLYPPTETPRPRTRAECVDHVGPCPWVACKFHLYLDINPENGSIKINFPGLEPWEVDRKRQDRRGDARP
jgi:hypothetical protein